LPLSLANLVTDSGEGRDEGQYGGAKQYGSYNDNGVGKSDYDKGFRFVCINNNNNTVVVEEPRPLPPIPPTCEECFDANLELKAVIESLLGDPNRVSLAFTNIDTGETIEIDTSIDTTEQLCPLLEGHTDTLIEAVIESIVERQTGSVTGFEASIAELIECLLEAEVIVEATPISGG
jgi:hypothetical protein